MTLPELKKEVNEFCGVYLPQDIDKYSKGKIIHDTTWGTNFFEPYEISLINTPLIQRLRNISQMGFTNYVYPSARHSRFEHSLGVAILVKKMYDFAKKPKETYLDEKDLVSLRMSALLHDAGHCLYSHTSELVYTELLDDTIEEQFSNQMVDPSSHEFLSFLIVTSDNFKKYFSKLTSYYKLDLDIEEIALRIVGGATSESKRFLTSFINGPFDADKLDYFHRDSQFSGIPVQLDLDRLLYEISISEVPEESAIVKDLTIGTKGVTSIEQIIFNKMLLYSTVYSHQKVQAIDCMVKGVFEYIRQHDVLIKVNGKEKSISSPVDFLYLVDYNLFSIMDNTCDPILKRLIKNIQERKLLKRVLVLNRNTMHGNLSRILSTSVNREERNKELRALVGEIYDLAKPDCDPAEIWFDIPKVPAFKEASQTFVRIHHGDEQPIFENIDKFYPYNQFKELYDIHKLNGHLYAPEHCIREIKVAAHKVFKDTLGIELTEAA